MSRREHRQVERDLPDEPLGPALFRHHGSGGGEGKQTALRANLGVVFFASMVLEEDGEGK